MAARAATDQMGKSDCSCLCPGTLQGSLHQGSSPKSIQTTAYEIKHVQAKRDRDDLY